VYFSWSHVFPASGGVRSHHCVFFPPFCQFFFPGPSPLDPSSDDLVLSLTAVLHSSVLLPSLFFLFLFFERIWGDWSPYIKFPGPGHSLPLSRCWLSFFLFLKPGNFHRGVLLGPRSPTNGSFFHPCRMGSPAFGFPISRRVPPRPFCEYFYLLTRGSCPRL